MIDTAMLHIAIISAATNLLQVGGLGAGAGSLGTEVSPEGDARGIGMIGDGWDGPGQNATTVYFHFENAQTPGGASQRTQFIGILEDWAEVVQIHFVESAVANRERCIDVLWARGDHCALELDECGQAGCVFLDSMVNQSIAHAAYPPGVQTLCGGLSQESRAGNIHFNLNAPIQNDPGAAGYSYRLVAAKMVGHAIGLQPNPNPGDHNVMGPIEWNEPYLGISADDAAQIRGGYGAGVGGVDTLEDLGVWVNGSWGGQELGTPGSPFNTVAEGVAGVPPFGDGVVVHVQAGLYPESIIIERPCILTSEFGVAFIGQ